MKQLMILALFAFMVSCSSSSVQQEEEPQTTTTATPSPASAPIKKKVAAATGRINWLSFEEAQQKMNKEARKVIVDVYTPWCGPCKMMDRSTFQDPEVIKHINENYYAVKFNGESGDDVQFKGKTYTNPKFDPNRPKNRRNAAHQLTAILGIRGYPTLIVFDSKFNKLENIVGYRKAGQLLDELAKL